MTNVKSVLENEGLTVKQKGHVYIVKDMIGNEIKLISENEKIKVIDRNYDYEYCNLNETKQIVYSVFSALESENN